MNKSRTALILVNVGTPERPDKRSVRKYLKEFLNDKRVIDLPWLIRKILVNLIIIPFRVKRSTYLYKKLWTKKGSPLLIYTYSLVDKIRARAGGKADVYAAMRYGKPRLDAAIEKICNKDYDSITIFPMYPQFAESTTGSVLDMVRRYNETGRRGAEPLIIEQFWSHPAFIDCFSEKIRSSLPEKFDHVIFSYHGLPLRQVKKIHPEHKPEECICEKEMPPWGRKCYKATCYGTTRLLAEKLALSNDLYSTSFQSRLTRNWLSPFTDETIVNLAKEGAKRILLVAPSFVTDCLETIVEIEDEYRELFLDKGGSELVLVKSLNDSAAWAKAILDIAGMDSPD